MDDDVGDTWGSQAIAAAEASGSTSSKPAEAWYKRWTRRILILGQLWDCRPEHLKEEVGCVLLLFSTLPLWFFPLISSILFTVDLPFFAETVSSGELLIYAASLSGAMVYFIAKRYGVDPKLAGLFSP